MGGTRFDGASEPSPEWRAFGSFCFMIPRLELLEAAGCCLLSCTLAWKPTLGPQDRGYTSLEAAVQDAQACLSASAGPAPPSAPALQISRESLQHCPSKEEWQSTMNHVHGRLSASSDTATQHDGSGVPGPLLQNINLQMARDEYELNGQQGLDQLLSVLGGEEVQGQGVVDAQSGLTKVVLARRSDVAFRGHLDPLLLLAALQEKDPRAYQFCLQLPDGSSFLGSSPEQLYSRTADSVASEAVAATRPRGPLGDVERDFWLAYDLLQNPKDHAEFTIVRNWVQKALQGVCTDVTIEREKSILKQGAIQHLYGRLSGKLREGVNDASLLAALHPTPAVCGRPREGALAALSAAEPFDRGFYSGPFGWISGAAAEFAVAIRSALVHGDDSMQGSAGSAASAGALPASGFGLAVRAAKQETNQGGRSHVSISSPAGSGTAQTSTKTVLDRQRRVSMYAGVGLVCGSDADKEWQELDLKVRPLNNLLRGPPALSEAANVNMLWAHLMVDELCRLGASTFCIAPGSRSSPLTAAAAMHPRARIVPCIDERSLAFWALGFGQANGTPAVVITSSGTAVANLLPAVVEASQSNVPMIVLSADRPGELRDTGANQTIDQVKIFGGYTRWAFDLPPPSTSVLARMALTTVGTAHRHSVSPCPGPVHINVQLREPLSPVQHPWSPQVLQGLERWEGSDLPYTSHALPPPPQAFHSTAYSGAPFAGCIAAAKRGIIVVGQVTKPEQAAAALNIAEGLGWPLVADVLSGLRIGASGHTPARVLQHFDHVLLDKDEVWPAVRPDVILQLGGRITSKRTSQFLEWAAQPSESRTAADWIFAADVADRHDQMHLVAHHVQMPLSTLANVLTEGCENNATVASYGGLLAELDGAAARQIQESLSQLPELCEPHVAHDLAQALPPGNGLFLGNSMPIRDMDMYGGAMTAPVHSPSPTTQVSSGLGAPVAANRGASGIDGVLSSAAGFAFGLSRGVTLVVGDISFLHDINGLCLLRSGEMRPPLTVVLINNSGGGIFSFLPIANDIEEDVFTQLWSTPQNVDLAGMCRAHGIAHQRVTEREGLSSALRAAWALNKHSVVEVIVGRDSNVEHHRNIQAQVKASVLRTLRTLAPCVRETVDTVAGPPALALEVQRAAYEPYALPLKSQLTTGATDCSRRGFLLHLTFSQPDGQEARGTGEIAPLAGLHRESLLEAEEQLALLTAQLEGDAVPASLALLQGRITEWLQSSLGWAAGSMLPSVRCGLEGALLSALADAKRLPLHALLAGCPLPSAGSTPGTAVNALLHCQGTPEERAEEAKRLVSQGYKTLKIKVGRLQPSEDAAAVLHIREAVGSSVELRADANQNWCLSEALQFGHAVKAAGLQYIEEPVESLEDSLTFYQETGVPIALDETLDCAMRQGGPALLPDVRASEGVAAVVVKPGAVGGFEAALAIACWARSRGMQVVLSSAFESSIALGQFAHLAAALDTSAGSFVRSSKADALGTAHGLGTAEWFSADLVEKPLIPETIPGPNGQQYMGVPLSEPQAICAKSLMGSEDGHQGPSTASSTVLRETVRTEHGTYSFNMVLTEQQSCGTVDRREAQNGGAGQHPDTERPTVLLLHGFMGCAADWEPVSAALAVTCRCISIDLPGHGATDVLANGEGAFSIAAVAEALEDALAALHLDGVHVVGYSLGARVALELCARPGFTAASLTVVSGTAGIVDVQQRKARQEKDAGLAQALLKDGLPAFVETWYQQPMWQSLRAHARFTETVSARGSAAGAEALAAVLREASPGLAQPLWDILPSLPIPTQFVAGELDPKFAALATKMACTTKSISESVDRTDELLKFNGNSAELAAANGCTELDDSGRRAVIIEGCGHAIHTEQPQALVPVIRSLAQAADKARQFCD